MRRRWVRTMEEHVGTYVKIVRNILPTRVTAWAVGVLGERETRVESDVRVCSRKGNGSRGEAGRLTYRA